MKRNRTTRGANVLRTVLEETGLDSDEAAEVIQTELPPPQTAVAVAVAEEAFPSLPPGSQQEGGKVDLETHLKNCKNEEYTLPGGAYTIKSRHDADGKLAFVIAYISRPTSFEGAIPYNSGAPE